MGGEDGKTDNHADDSVDYAIISKNNCKADFITKVKF